MPTPFFDDANRRRLDGFPPEIQYVDLVTFFTLSSTDRAQIPVYSSATNRLGFALQLCTLRFMGFIPADLTSAPPAVVEYLARQLSIDATDFTNYGSRAQTQSDHTNAVMQYLGFRRATEVDFEALCAWLVERALEHDRPKLLYQLLCDRLHKAQIIRPGITRLQRMIASARLEAQTQTMQALTDIVTPSFRLVLDGLLVPDSQTGKTLLSTLRRRAISNSPQSIRANLEKIATLFEFGVFCWDLATIVNPNRIKQLATIARKTTARGLRRLTEERKYPILVAFLYQSSIDIVDETIDMFLRCLADTDARAKHDLDEYRIAYARSTNEKVKLFYEMGETVLDQQVPDSQLREAIFRRIPRATLESAVEESKRIARPLDDNHFDFLRLRYSYLRQFTPAFLQRFDFRSNLNEDSLVEAIGVIQSLNATGRRILPDSAPLAFVPAKWHGYVVGTDGKLDRHYYELCLLYELRNALRSGDIWLDWSRRYANPETYLIPKDRWQHLKSEACRMIGAPQEANTRLTARRAELEQLLEQVDTMLASDSKVRIENGELVVSPLEGEQRPKSAVALEEQVDALLPQVELTNLLVEVDRLTQFSKHFDHPSGSDSRNPEFLRYLYASLVTQGCNLSFTKMAQSARLSYDRLIWCNNWYLREDTLSKATAELVNFHYRQPLTQYWGGGTLSSSDGQRFPVSGKVRIAEALPRYFGYGKGVVFYTWTSDQYSQYGTKVIPATPRDATYVLDEILDNETELPILEHTTDTAGYTEIVFGLFDLLGLQFSPRIRDIADQHLYTFGETKKYPRLSSQLKGKINSNRISRHWEELLRVAGSLKMGWVTASLFISKLKSYPRQNSLTRALVEYGRLAKTIFTLRYLQSEPFRRRINHQLNKGEALHSLRHFLFFANHGKIRRKQEEEMSLAASCLNLITNAVIVWNTVYMNLAIEHLLATGYPVTKPDISHLSPARHGHVNPYGRLLFEIEKEFARKGLRPLRGQNR